jgi:hypothetical protein
VRKNTTTSRTGGTTAFSAPASAGIFALLNEMPFFGAPGGQGGAPYSKVWLQIYFHHATELRFFMTTQPPVRHRPSDGCHWLCRAALASVFLIKGATPTPHSPVNQKRTFRTRGNRRQLRALDLVKQATIGLRKKERRDL